MTRVEFPAVKILGRPPTTSADNIRWRWDAVALTMDDSRAERAGETREKLNMATETNAAETVYARVGADARSPEIPAEHDVYGWLVGSWDLDVRVYWAQDLSSKRLRAEAHFAWALEGRAIQDVWIMPRIGERSASLDPMQNMYGTTLRVWDATLKAWRIAWLNPAGQHFEQQIGRRVGAEVVQLGTRPDGTTTRWRFTEITSDSFRWLGESLQADGRTWTLEGEFRARRRHAHA